MGWEIKGRWKWAEGKFVFMEYGKNYVEGSSGSFSGPK